MDVRVGRFISIPDIEAQLAPNNYTYVHSLTYTFDNYTNTGIEVTQALTKNWILQTGLSVGSDTMPWNYGRESSESRARRKFRSALSRHRVAQGSRRDPSGTAWHTLDQRRRQGRPQRRADAINGGQWGYNNLQWVGGTYYHKINDYWHIAFET